MRRRTTGSAVVPALALLAITLTGCGAEGGGAGAAGAEAELGPLDEYFEKAYGDFDQDQAEREMREVEEVVAACMAEQGFEYVPVDVTQGMTFSPEEEELDVEWGTREFAEQYGYALTTDPYGDMAETMPEEEAFVDPNEDYVMAMSESEQEAYYVALHGDQAAVEEEMEAVEGEEEEFVYDWEQAGCHGRAQHEVMDSGAEDAGLAGLEEEMNGLWERAGQDPRIAEATAAWVSCMGEAGITGLATVDDAQAGVSQKVDAVYEEAWGDPGSMTEMPSEEEMAAVEADVQARVSALTEEEVATAVADFDCREEVGYDDTYQDVTFELQQEFVDAHRDELDAWVEAVTAGRS